MIWWKLNGILVRWRTLRSAFDWISRPCLKADRFGGRQACQVLSFHDRLCRRRTSPRSRWCGSLSTLPLKALQDSPETNWPQVPSRSSGVWTFFWSFLGETWPCAWRPDLHLLNRWDWLSPEVIDEAVTLRPRPLPESGPSVSLQAQWRPPLKSFYWR